MNSFKKLSLATAIAACAQGVLAQGLEEVIVTAQHTPETLQDAAIPISVATGEELARMGINDVSGLNNMSPALQVNRGGGSNASYFVRGVGNFTVNSYTDSAVAFNQDGVYLGRPTSTVASFLDVERVEVLKGPQGTLYGRNATGGAINVIPVKPILGENLGKLTLGFGNYNAIEANGAVNIAAGQSTAIRISGALLQNDGYLDDGSYETEDIAFRTQIFSEITDNFDARISVDYSEVNGKGPSGVVAGNYISTAATGGSAATDVNPANYTFIPAPANVSDPSGGYLTQATQDYLTQGTSAEGFVVGPGFVLQDGNDPLFQDNAGWGITGEFNLSMDFADLIIIPAYRLAEMDSSGRGSGFKALITQEETDQSSLEMRLSGSTGIADWLFGAYYFQENVEANFAPLQFTLNSHQEYEVETEATALFARVTFNLTDELRLVGGIRANEDTKAMDGSADVTVLICTDAPLGCLDNPALPAALTLEESYLALEAAGTISSRPTAPGPAGAVPYGTNAILSYTPTIVNDSETWSETTFRLGIEFDITPDSLLYASYETGYRSGGFALAAGKEIFDPEYIDAFTLGSKNRFFDDRLQLNAEAFYWGYEDQQVAHSGVDGNGANGFFTENIGASTIYGFDIDMLFQLAENTLLSSSIQYLKNELDEYIYETPDTGVPPLNNCVNTPGTDAATGRANYSVDCSGNEGFQSPEWSFNLGIEQTFALSDNFELVTDLDARYRDEFWAGSEFLAQQRQEAATKVDLSFTLNPYSGNWFVQLWGRNITDEATTTNRSISPTAGNLLSVTYTPPATYGVRGGINF